MDMKAMNKSKEVIKLSKPITVDELFELMEQNKEMFPGTFKKAKVGKAINFDVYMQILPKVIVKGNTVTVKKFNSSTKVGIGGGPMMDFKAMKQSKDAIKEGGLKSAIQAGPQYFHAVCDNMVELLKDY